MTDKKNIEFDSTLVSPFDSRYERQQRLRIIMIAIPLLFGLILFMSAYDIADFYRLNVTFIRMAATILFAYSGLNAILTYLQTGFKNPSTRKVNDIKPDQKDAQKIEKNLAELQLEIESLKNQTRNTLNSSNNLTEDESKKIISEVKDALLININSEASKEILLNIKDSFSIKSYIREIDKDYSKTVFRLNGEIQSQSRRGNLNLALGILTSLAGISLLGFFIFEFNQPEPKQLTEYTALALQFAPRLSLVILIELFAYFFLNLYKLSLHEIKYFQNEMTTIESKLVALKSAFFIDKEKTLSNVVEEIIKIDRNSILKKGQTTVEIEKHKIDNKHYTSIIDKISSLIKSEEKA